MDEGGAVQGIVRRASYLGDMIDYDVEVNGNLLTVVDTDPTRLVIHPEGSTVELALFEECIHLLPSI